MLPDAKPRPDWEPSFALITCSSLGCYRQCQHGSGAGNTADTHCVATCVTRTPLWRWNISRQCKLPGPTLQRRLPRQIGRRPASLHSPHDKALTNGARITALKAIDRVTYQKWLGMANAVPGCLHSSSANSTGQQACSAQRQAEWVAPEQVKVQMENTLPRVGPHVGDEPVATLSEAVLPRDLCSDLETPTQESRID